MQKWLDLDEILYLRVSEIADYGFDLEIRNSKWWMQCGWPKYNKQLDLSEFQGFRGRWFQIRPQIQQLNIVDPILFSLYRGLEFWFILSHIVVIVFLEKIDKSPEKSTLHRVGTCSFRIWCLFLDSMRDFLNLAVNAKKERKNSDFDSLFFHFSLATS